MPNEVNVDDILSYGYFKTILGLHHISNNPDVIKKDGNFEHHSQFCEDIGIELLVEAFRSYMKGRESQVMEVSEVSAIKLIEDFLDKMHIKYYYDPQNHDNKNVHDDMMASCRDLAGRTLISLVLNAVEREGDGLGLRAVRTVMILYCLNRKQDVQDSKYAARLLNNRIWYLQSSDRTRARIDLMACCNPSGKIGHCIARDQENEHKVKSTKNILRGLHSQLGDIPVEKSVLGSNILELIESHDKESMLLREESGKSSYRQFGEVEKGKIRSEIRQHRPFDNDREKVEYYDKGMSVFEGLEIDQIERFLARNRDKFVKNSPHRLSLI